MHLTSASILHLSLRVSFFFFSFARFLLVERISIWYPENRGFMCILRYSHFIAHLKEISSKIATKTFLVYSFFFESMTFSHWLFPRLFSAVYFQIQIIHHNSLLAICIFFRFWVHFTRVSLVFSVIFTRALLRSNFLLSTIVFLPLILCVSLCVRELHCSSQFFHISNQFYCNLLVQWIFDHFCILYPSVSSMWMYMSVANLVNIFGYDSICHFICVSIYKAQAQFYIFHV